MSRDGRLTRIRRRCLTCGRQAVAAQRGATATGQASLAGFEKAALSDDVESGCDGRDVRGLSLGRADADDHMQTVISSVIARAVTAGMPVGVHAASGAQANRYAEQGATIITAAVDDSALTGTVRRQLGIARASRDTNSLG